VGLVGQVGLVGRLRCSHTISFEIMSNQRVSCMYTWNIAMKTIESCNYNVIFGNFSNFPVFYEDTGGKYVL